MEYCFNMSFFMVYSITDVIIVSHSCRINEAVAFKDCKIQVASYMISLKVEPSPALSVNLSTEPLIRIMLTHQLVGKQCFCAHTVTFNSL